MDLIQNKLSQKKWNGLHMQIETIFHSIPVLLHHLANLFNITGYIYIITIKYYNDNISAIFISKAEKPLFIVQQRQYSS